MERWAMATWFHMFNSTLTGKARVWFDDLPQESINSYDELKKAFLENYLQQKKCIKDLVEIHNIKQRDGESMEEFVRRYKLECRDVKGAPECMKILGFMYGITNPKLIKRLHDKILNSLDEMMRVTTTFLREGRLSKLAEARTKARQVHPSHKNTKRNFGFGQRKIQASSANDNPDRKRNASKFCEFHGEVELKQSNRIDQAKAAKKGETLGKDKPLAILMVQPWQRAAKQRITQTFSPVPLIAFPPLGEEDGIEGLMIIEVEIGGHFIYRMYVDEGSSSEILYEHCINRFRPEVKNQMVPTTTPLVGFSGEIIWPLGQISLLVKIGDEEHSTSAWMNLMIVSSPSPYNEIIGRPGVRRIQAVPSTAHRMLKFPVTGGTVTLQSSGIIPLECIMVSGPGVPQPIINQVIEEKI
ncbi:reverse transcriptase domain-containing protein [Tanacetum coccineum]